MTPLLHSNNPPYYHPLVADFAINTHSNPRRPIIILGTIHHDSADYSTDDLVKIFKTVNPAVILFECYKSLCFTDDYEFKEVWKNSVEQKAILEFHKTASVKIRPYDIDNRNEFYIEHKFNENEEDLHDAIQKLYVKDELPAEARWWWEAKNAMYDIMHEFKRTPLYENSAGHDRLIKYKNYYLHEGNRKIIDTVPSLKKFKDYWELEINYWDKRNNVMIENIIKWTKKFKGERILVQCGSEHRYYLIDGLKKLQKKHGFKLKEYWEY